MRLLRRQKEPASTAQGLQSEGGETIVATEAVKLPQSGAMTLDPNQPSFPALSQLLNEDREHLLRWLQARKDFPGLDVGPEPPCLFSDVREEVLREFNRTA